MTAPTPAPAVTRPQLLARLEGRLGPEYMSRFFRPRRSRHNRLLDRFIKGLAPDGQAIDERNAVAIVETFAWITWAVGGRYAKPLRSTPPRPALKGGTA